MKNKFSVKSMCVGFIMGSLFFGTASFASEAVTGYLNTQKISVNGVESSVQTVQVDGYNYGKIRDVATALGSSVNYDESTNTILLTTSSITTPTATITPSPSATPSSTVTPTPTVTTKEVSSVSETITDTIATEPTYETKNDIDYAYLNGKTYIKLASAWSMGNKNIQLIYDDSNKTIKFINKETNEIIIDNIPVIPFGNGGYLDYDNFTSNILPKIK